MSATSRSRALKIIAALAISAAIVSLLAAQLDLDRAASLLRAAELAWLVGALIGTAALIWVRGARFRLIFPQPDLVTTSCAIGVQTIVNRIAPMRLGELSLPYLLNRAAGSSAAGALITLALIRVVEIATTLALLATAILLRGAIESVAWFAFLLVVLVVVLFALARFRQTLSFGVRLLTRIARLTRLDAINIVGRGTASLARAADEAPSLSPRVRLHVLALTVAALCIQIGVFASILAAFSVEVSTLALVQASCVTFVGAVIPIPTVGTIGTLEASWAAGFLWVGMNLETAIFTGIATQIITLLISAVLAVPCFVVLRQRRRRLLGEISAAL